jgi:hypothetical protein
MDDLAYWITKLRDAEAELESARTRTAINAAAKRVMRAKAELKRLEADRPKRPSRGSRSAGAPS